MMHQPPTHQATSYNASVKIVRRAADAMVIRVFPDFQKPKYQGGQYGSLGLASTTAPGKLLKRAYSLSSSIVDLESGRPLDPREDPFFEFYFNRVTSAHTESREQLTPKLFAIQDGDRIFCGSKIAGHYTLEHVPVGANVLLVATTTGEAANNSILNQFFFERRTGMVASLLWGPEGWKSLYAREHDLLSASQDGRYKVIHFSSNSPLDLEPIIARCLSQPRHSTDLLGFPLIPGATHILLCGDPAMIGAASKLGAWSYETPAHGLIPLLSQHGFRVGTRFKQGDIEHEAYW